MQKDPSLKSNGEPSKGGPLWEMKQDYDITSFLQPSVLEIRGKKEVFWSGRIVHTENHHIKKKKKKDKLI